MSEYQDALSSKNGVIYLGISKILNINMGWVYNIRNQGHLDPDQGD